MAAVIKALVKGYNKYLQEFSDDRTRDWPLMSSAVPVFAILAFYLWFVLKSGPEFMKNRRPFELDRIIQAYNVLQVLVCGYLAVVGFTQIYGPYGSYSIWCEALDMKSTDEMSIFTLRGFTQIYGPFGRYSIWCEPLDMESTDETAMFTLKLFYVYFLTKLLDLMDTVFFVLRKKEAQITFLHVYHHSIMIIIIWYAMRFLPGGHGVFVGLINALVHAVMYAYYFMTNWNKEYRKNLWWKKHITQLQMFQFFAIFFHFSQFLLFQSCNYPRLPIMVLLPQVTFIIILFSDFYWKTYIKKKAPPKEKSK